MVQYKIVVYVPLTHTDIVRSVIGEAGGGKLGNYSFCSFSIKGVGRFLPGMGAHPAIGEVGKLEQVEEERIEVTVFGDITRDNVVAAIKKVHPYEEIAMDIWQLRDF
jgi:hypothetical protein